MRSLSTIILVLFTALSANAVHIKKNEPTVLQSAMQKLDSLCANRVLTDSSMQSVALSNPYIYKIFGPAYYYFSPIHSALEEEVQGSRQQEIRCSDKALLAAYLSHPEMIRGVEDKNVTTLDDKQKAKGKKAAAETQNVKVAEIAPDLLETQIDDDMKLDMVVMKPNFWKKNGSFMLQFTQNYLSENWYKGGESSNTMLSGFVYEANYNNQQGIEFANKLEMKLGFVSSKADSIHKYKTNNDLIRLTSKFGVRAVKNWYYTLSAEFNTQFMAGYKTNNTTRYSNFLSPMNLIVSLGMEYKRNEKKYTMACNLSPVAYNYRYVDDKMVDPKAYGIKDGRRLNDVGSKVQVNSKVTLLPNVTWTSLFYYFTDYSKIESYWENTFDFKISRTLSTQMFVHGRFDDSQTKDIQLKEYLSFGLNYAW